MSVRFDRDTIRLEGDCSLEDAEQLLQLLLLHRAAAIDWRECEYAHTAVVQLLLAADRAVIGPPRDAFLALHAHPALPGVEPGT